ncbi:flagellar hook-basal body complex protein [Clostridium lacusfryxellense]|uniref:flagellar hook-basal body complex protein n=1 Tax=Clostridium lacusfryxellense TaxID=205328 RepID=UPI001C0AFA94|nr:flagellar hook-basal body complex protein [Clostridium lacusfryxellense]MBU3111788.1 flagellar hook-basal body complex protein [Clostridium lacusfryxellense]
MLRSLYSGISGMKVNQVKLDVIANNIANVGTTAFKSSRVRFQDMVSQSMSQALAPGTNQGGVNPKQVGLGVQVAGIDTMVGQGMMQPTSRNLDVAMDGEGYLMLGKGQTPKGTAVVGIIDAAAPTTTTTGATASGVALNTDSTVGATNGLNLSYTRDGALTLDNEGNLLNSDGLRILGYSVTDGTSVSLDYDINGKSVSKYVNADDKGIKTSPNLLPLVIPDTIYVPGTPAIAAVAANGTTPAVVGVAATLGTTARITTFSIEKDGTIKAVLDSGKVAVLGQIAMVSFKNPAGLEKVGGNVVTNTSNSGEPVIRSGVGTTTNNNSAGYGDMLQGMLEMSNVDLAEQFTDMIVSQRAFQASGKAITTGDEILQEIIGLKR